MNNEALAALEDLVATVKQAAVAEEVDNTNSYATGAQFVLDEDASLTPRWGKGTEVLWAKGESAFMAGPAGVGKTTITHQLMGALVGILPEVLGYPVIEAQRVLYLALDRPSQIRRAMRRIFGEQHRETLAERLVVWRTPLPQDIGKHPGILLDLAQRFGCDVVIIDSLKDAAVGLSDDEVGGNVNRAIQACLAAGVDVFILHHQRKGQGGSKPTSLEDVYGNTWIVAGAGSVILLWGEAGSELVELTHLKQPADPVGPLKLEHNHHEGRTMVTHGWDALSFLRMKGAKGATLVDAAQAEHGTTDLSDARKKKTERKLRALVRGGLARWQGQERDDGGGWNQARWYATDDLDNLISTVDTTVDTGVYPQARGRRLSTVDTETVSAGQTVDTTVDNRGHQPPWTLGGGSIDPPNVRGRVPEEEIDAFEALFGGEGDED